MIAHGIAALAVCLTVGDVVTVSPRTLLVRPGTRANWELGEPTIAVDAPTPAIVTRLRPLGLADVVEVKLWGGLDRLAWMATPDAVAGRKERARVKVTPYAAGLGTPGVVTWEDNSYGYRANFAARRRSASIAQIDAALGGMAAYSMANAYKTSDGYEPFRQRVVSGPSASGR